MSAPQTKDKPSAPDVTEEAAPKSGKGFLMKVIVLVFILAIIGAECLFACMYIASATSKASPRESGASDAESKEDGEEGEHKDAHGEEAGGKDNAKEEHGHGKSEHGTEDDGEKHGEETGHGEKEGHAHASSLPEMEVDLGEFSLTALQPASNTTLLIEFHLFGTIRTAKDDQFSELYEGNRHRIREQVLMTIRSAELADLTDPGLGLIKRQILEKTNRALGKPLLLGVIFSDFIVVEQ